MQPISPVPERIAIITHPSLPDAPPLAEEIAAFLKAEGVKQVVWGLYSNPQLRATVSSGGFDLLIALGGDGTILRAGHLGAPHGVPILGINVGRFGFLTEVQKDEWRTLLPRVLAGNYRLEERMMLYAEHCRRGETIGRWDVINDVVVARGRYIRPVHITATVDGYHLAAYVADGLIAATPTGSSAYALAVGGPIMPPDLRNILIVPVAPHLSVDRAIILSEGATVTITVSTNHEAVFSIDGQPTIPLEEGDAVRVGANTQVVHFVRFQDPGYFYRNIMRYMEQNPTTGKTP